MKVHNKLVRDKIPEIIEKDGKTCVTHILSGEKYIVALETKLNEEVAEFKNAVFSHRHNLYGFLNGFRCLIQRLTRLL